MKTVIAILIALTLGVVVEMFFQHRQIEAERRDTSARLVQTSNSLEQAQLDVQERDKRLDWLQTELSRHDQLLNEATNKLVTVTEDLTSAIKARGDFEKQAQIAEGEVKARDARIAQLETQQDSLNKTMEELNGSIRVKTQLIAETEKKLATSECDRGFLLKELERLRGEKTELEQQFNDLASLRRQVARIKENLATSRRLDWARRGVYDQQSQKGAERLMIANNGANAAKTTAADLNVEFKTDGSPVVVPTQPRPSAKPAQPVPAAPPK